MPVDVVRDSAIDVLLRVFEKGAHIGQAVDKTLRRKKGRLSPQGTRFMTRLVYGTTRNVRLADYVLEPLLKQPMEKLPLPILLILRMGVYQALFCDNVTFPSMVHTGVDLAKKRGHAGTARLVNAVLRRVPESIESVFLPEKEKDRFQFLSVRYSVPKWMIQRWAAEFGEHEAEAIVEACNEEAPITIRVNRLKISRRDLQKKLLKAGVESLPHPDVSAALILDKAAPVGSKSFQSGDFFIQDLGSMLPVELIEPGKDELILDMCAAPGGKSTHLAQICEGESLVVSNDLYRSKFRRIRENVTRLESPGIVCVASDATRAPFRGGAFDRVLLDAPCSGWGTLRRRPDLKMRVSESVIRRLAKQQEGLLRSAIRLCKNGGLVVYSVCTFTPEETGRIVESVLGDEPVQLEDGPEWINRWKISQGQYRILPTKGGPDGYFLARFRKTR